MLLRGSRDRRRQARGMVCLYAAVMFYPILVNQDHPAGWSLLYLRMQGLRYSRKPCIAFVYMKLLVGSITAARITSYNVCYTKLLRADGTVQQIGEEICMGSWEIEGDARNNFV